MCGDGPYRGGDLCRAHHTGKKGMLEGKRATCFPTMRDELAGAEKTDDAVCIDGLIVTSRSAGTAIDFGLALLDMLADKADDIAAQIHYRD